MSFQVYRFLFRTFLWVLLYFFRLIFFFPFPVKSELNDLFFKEKIAIF